MVLKNGGEIMAESEISDLKKALKRLDLRVSILSAILAILIIILIIGAIP